MFVLFSVVLVTLLFAFTSLSILKLTAVIAALMAVKAVFFGGVGLWALLLVGIPLAIINIDVLRQQITGRVYGIFRKVTPQMSSTEKEAIDAGTVWWDKDLFSGSPEWKKLLDVPPAKLSDEEIAFLNGPVEELCAAIDDWEITTKHHEIPEHIWELIRKHRFFGMIIPKEYGGLELSAYAQSQVVMKIATRSINVAVTVMVPNSLGPGELLLHFGTQDQRDEYLPKLAVAEEIPAFGLTGPNAGSDAGSIPDFGIVCKQEIDGKEVIGFRTTWEKRYITLGPICTVLGLAFKALDPDGILGDQEDLGITCALVPTDTDGVFIGHRHMPLNASFPNGPNAGKDVFIPMDWIIGKEEGVGRGWRMLMSCLGVGRSISLPALGVSSGKMGSAILGLYTRTRRQFNTSISNFEGVKEPMGRVAGLTYMIDAGRIMTAHAIDRGENPTVISAILKMHNTDSMRTILSDTMDILGGRAICMGPHNPFARAWQYAPIGITVEGANILTRSLMIFGQGAIRCHPYVLAEMESAYETDYKKGEAMFDEAFSGHVGLIFRNMVRSFYFGVSSNKFAKAPVSDASAAYYKNFTRLSSNFTFVADICMGILGGELKKKESISGRLGDCLSFLYYGSAVLKKWRDEGSLKQDWPIAKWALDYCCYRIQKALDEIFDNFPIKPVGFVLKKICFPFGIKYAYPSDKVTHKASDILANPELEDVVERLTDGVYVTDDPEDITGGGAFRAARDAVVAAEPVIKKYKKATGHTYNSILDTEQLVQAVEDGAITADEAELLKEAARMSRKVIAVDSFSPESAKAGWVEADPFDGVFEQAIVLNEGKKKGKGKGKKAS